MTWYLAALAAALVLLVGGGWLLLHEPRHEAAALDHDLDALEVHHETMRYVRPADLGRVEKDSGATAASAGTGDTRVGAPELDDVGGGQASAPGMREADRGGIADASGRLTPAQRRRALHKGRLPRNLPGPDAHGISAGRSRLVPDRAGELYLPGGVAPAPAAGEFHRRDERLPAPLTIWDHGRLMPIFPTLLESAEYEARFRHDWGELGRLRREAWAWWGAPGRWDLAA